MSDRSRHRVSDVGRMMRVSDVAGRRRLRPTVDPAYHDALAKRLADAAGLPLALARRRVMALAISARPRPPTMAFRIGVDDAGAIRRAGRGRPEALGGRPE
jgi:hypothetical protein